MPCPQYVTLEQEWPCTLRVLESSFLPELKMSVTDAKGNNPAGYLVWQLRRAYRHAQAVHGEVRGSIASCDQQFACEVRYHLAKKTEFRNVIPALGSCWYNLVHERSERFRECNIVRKGTVTSIGEIFREDKFSASS